MTTDSARDRAARLVHRSHRRPRRRAGPSRRRRPRRRRLRPAPTARSARCSWRPRPAGLVRLAFQREDDDDVLEELAERISPRVLEAPGRVDEVRRELDEYFDGRRDHFELPLDWRLSSGFRRTVLETLYADVDYGHTVSYLELATMVGNPKASRAVGTAMATNPIPIVVPCHRVLRTGGQLGGYGGGLPAKVTLLELEAGDQTLF